MLKLDFEFLQDSDFDLGLTGFGELELSFLDDEQEDNNNNDDSKRTPGDFKEYDESIETDHECPKCGYKWSGGK
jgi:hypothetical protein